uniref:WD-40 repeat protein n=1 Tax=uncultured bacterium esnapd14 TaxID=1366594 RepID=S5UBF3_9BACT|nr:WD-40 repeat protein [uncultured bacterium esnapd14]
MVPWIAAVLVGVSGFAVSWWLAEEAFRLDRSDALTIATVAGPALAAPLVMRAGRRAESVSTSEENASTEPDEIGPDDTGPAQPEVAKARLPSPQPPWDGELRFARAVRGISWAHDSQQLLTICADGRVQTWRPTPDGTQPRMIGRVAPGRLTALAWHDHELLITTTRTAAQAWNPLTAELLRTVPPDGLKLAAWSINGRYVATVNGLSRLQIWEPATNRAPRIPRLSGYGVRLLGWSRDFRQLAIGYDSKVVKIWDCEREESVALLRHKRTLRQFGWSTDGTEFYMWDRKEEHVWDAATFRHQTTRPNWTMPYDMWDVSADRKYVSGLTKNGQILRVWQWSTNEELYRTRIPLWSPWTMAFSPDSRHLAFANKSVLKILDVVTGAIRSYEGHVGGIEFLRWAPDCQHVASVSGATVRVWPVATPHSAG